MDNTKKSNVNGEKFTPMRHSFAFLYASVVFLFLSFIGSGMWFSSTIKGFSNAINLAGTERMRTMEIALYIKRAFDEPSPQREKTLGHVKVEMDRFEEVLNALKDGSLKYKLKDVTDSEVDKELDLLINKWEDVFKPQLNAVLISSPQDGRKVMEVYYDKIHDFVEGDINHVVLMLVDRVNHTEHVFIILRVVFTVLGILLIGANILYVQRRILKPISVLIDDTQEIARGNYLISVNVTTSNEVMLLAQRFNAMTEAISQSFNRMEETVEARTHDLSVTNARMQSFFDSTPDAIVSINSIDRCIILFSKAAERIFGYNADEVLGKNVNILMPEPYHSRHDNFVNSYLETGTKKVIGLIRMARAIRKNGEIFEIDLSVSESVTPSGRVFNGIIRDISTRIKVEREMQKLFNAIEQSAESVVITDRVGKIEYVNPAFERATGYTRAEAIGKTPRILKSGKQSRDFYKQLWDTILEGSVWHGEIINKRKNGDLYYEDAIITPIKDNRGEVTHFVAMKYDVTPRKLAEFEVEDKNKELGLRARYDKAFAKILSLFSSTFDQRQALHNMLPLLSETLPFPCSAFYAYDEWRGKLIHEASYGVSGSIKLEFDLNEGVVGQSVINGAAIEIEGSEQFPFVIETGILTITPSVIVVQPVFYQKKILGVLVIASISPLSEHDRAFMQSLASNIGISLQNLRQYSDMQELSAQIKLRGDEIAQKNLQLEESNRLKSEFLANMSHELRTPLNAIIGFSEVLKDGILGDLSEEQRDYVNDIFTSGQHLLSLINDILDLSKIEAGKMTLDLEKVNIASLLENSLSIIKEKALAHGIKLTMDIQQIDDVYLDSRKTKQIVYNLLSNAVKFTHDKGAVSVIVRVVSQEGSKFMEISVRDTGIGMSEEGMRRLFRPFEQIDGSLSRRYEGTGLGLAMVKRLVELHGGTVGVESQEGKGSCFTAWLPYRQDSDMDVSVYRALVDMRTARETAPETMTKSSYTPLVLIVEDDPRSVELIRPQLQSEGYSTIIAATAQKGLDIAESKQPDLITLDILLPDMHGWEFLEKMKANKKIAHIPVIIVSVVADQNKGFSLGASNVLQKPVSRDELLAAIRQTGIVSQDVHRPLKVLVVDDDPKAVDIVSSYLKAENCTVLRAYGGREGIEIARLELPDLLVLDLMMPEVTGFDVVHALKDSPDTADINIIILTAKIITEDDRKALNSSVLKIVQKGSFSSTDLLSDARRALRGKAAAVAVISDAVDSKPPRQQAIARVMQRPPLGIKEGGYAEGGSTVVEQEGTLILVIEDNVSQAALLKLLLESEGYRVMLAANGKEALDVMSQFRPNLVCLDLMMPDMDGFTFLDEKANHHDFADIPVIVVSSIAESVRGTSLSANAFLKKPISRQEILDLVGSLTGIAKKDTKLKILLIDDDPKALKIISSYFDTNVYEIIKEYGGKEGLYTAIVSKPDFIVLDLMMPEMNGFEVLQELKQNETTRDIPVVILTAKVLTKDERQELQSKVVTIFEKGQSNKEDFLRNIESLLQKKGASRTGNKRCEPHWQ
ncbi:MAG: response regulator [Nitrospirae bacterium]|nr:response regulator [Nitrospirota bacterium]MBF0592250.1 response regulator [Nitrospirota bacterium]